LKFVIELKGDDFVIVNDNYKVKIDSFVQTMRDVNKSENDIFMAYSGE